MEAATRGLDPNNNAPMRNNETDPTSDHRGVQQGSDEAFLGQKRARKEVCFLPKLANFIFLTNDSRTIRLFFQLILLTCVCKTVPKEHVTPVVPPPINFWGQPSKTTDIPTPLPVSQEEMELGFLRFRQSLEKGEEALVIKDDAIVGLYHAAATELAGDFPPLPQKGVLHKTVKGPWNLYFSLDICLAFAAEVKEVIYYEIEDGLPTGEARTLKISAHKLDDAAGGSKSSRLTPEQLDEVAVHICIKLEEHQFLRFGASHMEAALDNHGILVFKGNQPQVKMNGVAIGPGCETNLFHFNVRPKNGPICGFDWPPLIDVSFMAHRHNKTMQGASLKYHMYEQKELSGKICLLGCHKYFRNSGMTKLSYCECEEKRAAATASQAAGGARQPRRNLAATSSMLHDKYGPKKDVECPAFLKGKCGFVKVDAKRPCGFKHDMGVDPRTIKCAMPVSAFGNVCKNGGRCGYLHDNQEHYDNFVCANISQISYIRKVEEINFLLKILIYHIGRIYMTCKTNLLPWFVLHHQARQLLSEVSEIAESGKDRRSTRKPQCSDEMARARRADITQQPLRNMLDFDRTLGFPGVSNHSLPYDDTKQQ